MFNDGCQLFLIPVCVRRLPVAGGLSQTQAAGVVVRAGGVITQRLYRRNFILRQPGILSHVRKQQHVVLTTNCLTNYQTQNIWRDDFIIFILFLLRPLIWPALRAVHILLSFLSFSSLSYWVRKCSHTGEFSFEGRASSSSPSFSLAMLTLARGFVRLVWLLHIRSGSPLIYVRVGTWFKLFWTVELDLHELNYVSKNLAHGWTKADVAYQSVRHKS